MTHGHFYRIKCQSRVVTSHQSWPRLLRQGHRGSYNDCDGYSAKAEVGLADVVSGPSSCTPRRVGCYNHSRKMPRLQLEAAVEVEGGWMEQFFLTEIIEFLGQQSCK